MELKPRGKKIIDRTAAPISAGRFKYTIMNNAVEIDNIFICLSNNESILMVTRSPAGFERGCYKLSFKDINTILITIEELWKTKDRYQHTFKSKGKEILISSVPSSYYEVEDNRLMYITINNKCMVYALDKYDSRRFYAMLKEMLLYNKTCKLRKI